MPIFFFQKHFWIKNIPKQTLEKNWLINFIVILICKSVRNCNGGKG